MYKFYRHCNTYVLIVLILIALQNNLYNCLYTINLQNPALNRKINYYHGPYHHKICYLLRFKPTSTGKFRIKPKTNKSIAKRFKITGSGKLMHKRSGIQHLRSKLKSRQRRRLRRPVVITSNKLRKKYIQAINT
ncbi:hypothetical protein BMR1_02g01270 [Babesia microti strain RI]|uniref:50S ribosomal protein L35 n=1 Tax=Babesia microti (strain RI) TaxID=1133968 RepID=I7J622_BABMR|nr:hypothetical protein BMR1_02g01270 [Babesia microti strain RI]CCF73417.1 hypothetical protein BMR1_02g01270 [Babesia microti strain RI]|eukprot:XP_012648026.1 hypothetical protein BMR1_02g01270 [Babesia microti strain RI]